MPISVKCTGCNRVLDVPDSFAGKKGKCPYCLKVLDIPAAGAQAEPNVTLSSQGAPISPEHPEHSGAQSDSSAERYLSDSAAPGSHVELIPSAVSDETSTRISRGKGTGALARVSGALDFSFNRFIWISVIQRIYIFGIFISVVAAITASIRTVGLFHVKDRDFVVIVLAFMFGAGLSVVNVVILRLFCEMLVVVFRIAENTTDIISHLKRIKD